MEPKVKLYMDLRTICQAILDDIVAPACGISDIGADYWLCDIETYTMGEDKVTEKIVSEIARKYGLTEDQMAYIDGYTPLMNVALFIYLTSKD